MDSKKVWDTDDVYSLKDFVHHPHIPEAMLGRVFSIIGVKNEDLGEALKTWKARCVFQGSNVRTKTGTSAADLFKETSNAPASFAAARAALGVAALRVSMPLSAMPRRLICKRSLTRLQGPQLSLSYRENGGPILGSKTAQHVRSQSTIVRIADCGRPCMDTPKLELFGRLV